jgi:hypothetical protein
VNPIPPSPSAQSHREASARRSAAPALVGLGLAALLASCAAKRELVILSEPTGAQVRLDNQIVGWTPYTTSFEAYGTRRVTLYREGYRSESLLVDLEPPWYGRFPFDFFSEVLIPVGWHDRHVVGIQLLREGGEVTEPDLEALLEQAETLRRATPEGPLRTLPGATERPRD